MGQGASMLAQCILHREIPARRRSDSGYLEYPIARSLHSHTITLGGSPMPSSVWKGTLSFGLLAIPVKLYTAARSQRMNLHQLHKVCHMGWKAKLYCTRGDRRW